ENDALDEGWVNGLNLIQRISANARYFTDLASKIPFDVAQGNAAAGMSIDFYGRTANETVKKPDGTSRVSFVIPEAGTSVSSDPIALLRGAPRPELANKFIHFLLSPTGQRLWHYQVGLENGPEKKALRRMPIRKDAYLPAELAKSTDPESAPYEQSRDFVYRPEWTGPHSNVIRFIIQVMCLETHEELKEAWTALIEAGFPPRATSIFYDVQFVGYTSVTHELSPKLRTDDALAIQKRRRTLRENFRTNYLRAARLARQGQ
ncbi:MAG: extracellular solute-binding protein, partial [Verrucomicrobiota bacterium]